MHGETLTPHRRATLYERVLEETDLDAQHLVIHALAATPDGPLVIRQDYGGLDVKDWTPAEMLDDYIEVTGVPERDPFGPVSVLVRVTAAPDDERFEAIDLFEAVAASAREVYPVDGQPGPSLPRFEMFADRDLGPADVVVETFASGGSTKSFPSSNQD